MMHYYFMRFADQAEADEFLKDYFTPEEGEYNAGTMDLSQGNKAAHKAGTLAIGVDENLVPVYDGFYYVHLRSETSLSKPTAYLVPDGEPRPAHRFAEQK